MKESDGSLGEERGPLSLQYAAGRAQGREELLTTCLSGETG